MEDNKIRKDAKCEYEFHWLVKLILGLMIASGIFSSISKLFSNLMFEQAQVGIFCFVLEMINAGLLIFVFRKKLWGLLVYFGMMFLQIPLNYLWGNHDIDNVLLSAIIRSIIVSLVLFIPYNKKTAWRVFIENNRIVYLSRWKSMLVSDAHMSKSVEQDEVCAEPILGNQYDENNLTNTQETKTGVESGNVHNKPKKSKRTASGRPNINLKTKKTGGSVKYLKVSIYFLCGIIVLFATSSVVITLKKYPEFILSYGDKWRYTFNLPNDNLAKLLVSKVSEKDSLSFVIVGKDHKLLDIGTPIKYSQIKYYYDDVSYAKVYKVTDDVIELNHIDKNDYYVAKLNNGNFVPVYGARLFCGDCLLKEDINKLYKTQLYDYRSEMEKDIKIIDDAATIPTNDIETIISILSFYCDNLTKGIDYLRFEKKYLKNNSELEGYLAASLYEIGEYEEAKKESLKSLEHNGKNIIALRILATIAADNNNWLEAKKLAKNAFDYGDKATDVVYIYAEALFKQGDKKTAREYYNKAYRINSANKFAEKYSECGGCPLDIISLHYGFKDIKGNTITDYDERLFSNRSKYLSIKIDVDVLRVEIAKLGIKIFENGELSTGVGSRNGYTYFYEFNPAYNFRSSIELPSWGADDYGNWSAGYYDIEIWYNGEKIADDSFIIH